MCLNVDIKYMESYQFESYSGIDTLGYNIPMKWPMGRPRSEWYSLACILCTMIPVIAIMAPAGGGRTAKLLI